MPGSIIRPGGRLRLNSPGQRSPARAPTPSSSVPPPTCYPRRVPIRCPARLLSICIALASGGCILDNETCGDGFVDTDGECVPRTDPDAPTDDDDAPDAAPVDVVDAGDPVGTSPYDGFEVVVLVDDSPFEEMQKSPATPGADIDAITAEGDDLVAEGFRILEAEIMDPFDASFALDPEAALGPPDWDAGRLDGIVSLGGGAVVVELLLTRTFRPGDTLTVHEAETAEGAADRYTAFLCPLDYRDPDRCVELGPASGVWAYRLP